MTRGREPVPFEVYEPGVYLHGTKADLAVGEMLSSGRESNFEADPNVTDKKFPGNPTRSFRSRAPLRVVGELTDWAGHPPEQLAAMRAGIERIGPGRIDD